MAATTWGLGLRLAGRLASQLVWLLRLAGSEFEGEAEREMIGRENEKKREHGRERDELANWK